jgi:hypothetical protein
MGYAARDTQAIPKQSTGFTSALNFHRVARSSYNATYSGPKNAYECPNFLPDGWRNRSTSFQVILQAFRRYMALRQATAEDLDALRDIALAAMPMDPQWDYRFPRRKEYPQDTSYWTRRQYEDYSSSIKPKYCTMVITVDIDGDGCNPPVNKPVALAVWDITFALEHDPATNGEKCTYHVVFAKFSGGLTTCLHLQLSPHHPTR